jgi:hypothetical protein
MLVLSKTDNGKTAAEKYMLPRRVCLYSSLDKSLMETQQVVVHTYNTHKL